MNCKKLNVTHALISYLVRALVPVQSCSKKMLRRYLVLETIVKKLKGLLVFDVEKLLPLKNSNNRVACCC